MYVSDAQKLLEILGEESRYKIVKLLLTSTNGLTVADIANRLNKDKRTIDKHLKLLLDAGLVERSSQTSDIYTYYATQKAAMLIELAEKLVKMQPLTGQFTISTKEEPIKIVRKRFNKIYSLLPSIILIILGLLIGYGSRFGIITPGNEGVKLLGMVFFIILSIIVYLIIRRGYK